MSSPVPGPDVRRIVVADEDPRAVEFIVETLREQGYVVFHAYDVLAVTQLVGSLVSCDLVISNTKVAGMDGVDLLHQLRRTHPALPIVYLANDGRSTPELERRLPAGVPILREPFAAETLRALVDRMLDGHQPPGGEFTGR
jgi:two-component system response regulator GlrR